MKNKKILTTSLLAALASGLGACAHAPTGPTLDEKLAAQPAVQSRQELHRQAGRLIESAPGLDAEQRARLKALSADTAAALDGYAADSLKLRAILLRDLMSTNYDRDEVSEIRDRLSDLENKRLDRTFEAVEKVNDILGRAEVNKERLLHEILEPHPRG